MKKLWELLLVFLNIFFRKIIKKASMVRYGYRNYKLIPPRQTTLQDASVSAVKKPALRTMPFKDIFNIKLRKAYWANAPPQEDSG
ncbi:MAG: hypothetical protein ACYC2T_10155 [Bacillota bacterium]